MSRIEIVEMSSGDVVRILDTSGKSDREVERTMAGLLRQMDTERFVAREVS